MAKFSISSVGPFIGSLFVPKTPRGRVRQAVFLVLMLLFFAGNLSHPAYWNGMGESTGKYLIALLDGTNKSWAQLLDSMRINEPWGESNYEPMRGVNGELDNVFDATRTPLTVAY